jgi:hypothetical protein
MNPDSSSAVASTDLARPGPRPRPVVAAVRLMYAGAALEVIGILLAIVRLSAVTSALAAADGYTTGRAHAIAEHQLAISATGALIGACLWVWMARANAARPTELFDSFLAGYAEVTTLTDDHRAAFRTSAILLGLRELSLWLGPLRNNSPASRLARLRVAELANLLEYRPAAHQDTR